MLLLGDGSDFLVRITFFLISCIYTVQKSTHRTKIVVIPSPKGNDTFWCMHLSLFAPVGMTLDIVLPLGGEGPIPPPAWDRWLWFSSCQLWCPFEYLLAPRWVCWKHSQQHFELDSDIIPSLLMWKLSPREGKQLT